MSCRVSSHCSSRSGRSRPQSYLPASRWAYTTGNGGASPCVQSRSRASCWCCSHWPEISCCSLLHISLPAFRIAGGILLFLQSLTLTFSSPGLSSINEGERCDAEKPGDIAVFPLAFPLIASPGTLSAAVLLAGRADGLLEQASIILMIGLCLMVTYIAMRAADVLVRFLGRTGADVVGRVSGILLAGLAVQFILDGLQYHPYVP